ncbi:PilN family type IVB pilus formation outer membrane protein [Escherichia coli]|nr:PilN family type IVB pilus formation outer membrane protein [Escherichia coli]
MKKLHQRSMKLAVLPCMIAVALSISGCTFSEINKMQKKAQEDSAHAREKVSALSARKSQALTWLDNQWINPVPVAQVSASSSTLTVTDTPAVQEAVARYVDEQNSIMNRQVALNVQVLSVSNTRNEQFGLDWNLVYKSLHSAGATLNNASGDFTGATSAGVSILDTATGNAAKFSGSSLLIKALSEQGDVSVVTSQESTVTNLTPVPIQMADQTVYVAQSATTTTTDVGATTTLTPGMITTGFNMTLLPLIQKTGNLQLQMNFNLSDPPTIRSFTSKDGNSYIEMPYTKLRSLSQKVNLKEGQSLVVTGFDQNNTTTSKAGTFTPANPLFGGSQTGKNERSTLVIIITPTFPSGGNNG